MILKSYRLPTLLAVSTSLGYGMLTLTIFPEDRQFTKYPQAAAEFLAQALPAERLLDFSPFYFYLHVAQQSLFPGWATGILVLQILAAGLSVALFFMLLHRFFPLWIATAGAVALVLNRSLMTYVSVLEPEMFLTLFLVVFLYFTLRSESRAWWVAGIALGLALAVRPNTLPLLMVVPVFFLLNRGRRQWLRPSATVLAPALLVLLALTLRNGMVAGHFSPLAMNPGFVFFEGNNPLSRGWSAVYPPLVGELKTELGDLPDNPHVTYRLVAARSSQRELSTAEANSYWWQKGLNFIFDHPAHYLQRLATKGYFILHDFRRHDLGTAFLYDQQLRETGVPAIPFALISSIALLGIGLAMPDWRRFLLIYALLAMQCATMLLMYVSDRQRLAILPCFVVFACAALAYLSATKGWKRVTCLGCTTLLACFFLLPNNLARENQHLWRGYEVSDQRWLQAIRLREQGQLREAADAAAAGYAAAPWLRDYARPAFLTFSPEGFAARALAKMDAGSADPSRQFDRAQLLLEAGKFREAETVLQPLVAQKETFDRGYLQSSHPLYYLASVAIKNRERAKAVALLEKAIAAAPGDPFILARLAALTGNDHYRQTLVRYFSEADAAFLIGIAQNETGELAAGQYNLDETARLLPELWRAKIYLAAAHGAGNSEVGVRLFCAATRERQDPVVLEEQIIPLFSRAVESAPGDAGLRYRYGLTLAQYGRLREALEQLKLSADVSAHPEVERALTQVRRMLARNAD